MATKKSARKKTTKKKIPVAGIAAGVAAAAAAAGAAYYFYGAKDAKQHRRKAAKWANDMKRDVVREAKKLQKLDDAVIHGVIDRVAGAYKGGKGITAEDLKSAVTELKANWRKVQGEARGTAKKAAKKARKAPKKAARKG